MKTSEEYSFNDFVVNTPRRSVTRGLERVALTPKEFATLLHLVERAGRAVSRDELIQAVWPDTTVGDTSLARNISVLRRHFGSNCIRAIPKFGYCFECPVKEIALPAEDGPLSGKLSQPLEDVQTHAAAFQAQASLRTLPLRWSVAGVAALLGVFAAGVPLVRHHQEVLHASGQSPAQSLQEIPARHRATPAVHAIYVQGRFELEQRTLESYRHAETLFQQAIALDPQYAEAYAGLSQVYIFMGGIIAETECFPKARQAAMAALKLDPNNADAHRNLGYLLMNQDAAIAESEREYQTAVRLNPRDARAHHWYAQLLAAERRTAESVHEAEIGYELEPASVASGANYAFMLTQNDQAGEAVILLERLLMREPNNDMAWGYLGFSQLKLHHYSKAASAFRTAAQKSTLKVNYLSCEAYALSRMHDRSKARKLLAVVHSRQQNNEWTPGECMVLIYLALGEREEAIEWLRRGTKDHTTTLFELATDPVYSELHASPRFADLYAELGGRS